jgi:IclR family acetate operon transcriptional repressor
MAKTATKEQSKGSVQSLNRALALLQLLAEHPDGLSLAEIAPLAELAPSTTHRLLSSLQALDFVSFETDNNRWFVGLAAFRAGAGYLRRRDHIATARQTMRQLVAQTGETSNLAVVKNATLTFVAQIECNEAMRMAVPLGARGPLHASAVGKAILAFTPKPQRETVFKQIEFTPLTEQSHAGVDQLREDLDTIRKRGFAIDDEEQSIGLRCIGAPIFDEFGEPIFAVSISGPTVRVKAEKVEELADHVMVAARHITDQIGGIAPRVI